MKVAKFEADVWRLVEVEAKSQSWHLTETEAEYEFLESYIDGGKPPFPTTGHDVLIATAFRYDVPTPPEYAARFKPPEGNPKAFYAAVDRETTFYEAAYHWLKERIHLTGLSRIPEPRTLFSVGFKAVALWDVSDEANVAALTDRRSYEASWAFVRAHPDVRSILFPSCRAPKRGLNLVTDDISTLEKKPTRESLAEYQLVYRAETQGCVFLSKYRVHPALTVTWSEVY